MNGGRRRLLALPLIVAAIVGLVWFVRGVSPVESGAEQYQRGLAALDTGELDRVRDTIEALRTQPEFERHARLLSAVLDLRTGNLDGAVGRFRDLPPEGPLRADILLHTGELMYRRGELDLALKLVRALLTERPESADGHRWAAAVLYDLGAFSMSESHLLQVAKLAPDDFRPHHLMGQMHFDFEQYELSVPDFRRVLERDPPSAVRGEIVVLLAKSLMKLRRYDEAAAVIDAERESPVLAALLAQCRLATGDAAGAHAVIARAERSGPVPPELRRLQGQLALLDGNTAMAVEHLEAAEQSQPFDVETLYQLSQAYRQAGRDDDAERIAKRHSETTALYDEMTALSRQALTDVTNAELRTQLADICRRLGKNELAASWDQAARTCRALAANSPETAPATDE